jgi:hypothetical protein
MGALKLRVVDREDAAERAERLARANLNPVTGLATDYLNHFNEAIMLLDMLSSCPDCADDFLAWRPKSYREHFAQSRFRDRQIAIEAYETAHPIARDRLERIANAMTSVLEAARDAMAGNMPAHAARNLAVWSVLWLKPLVAQAGAVINGDLDAGGPSMPQAAVDALLRR